MDPAIVVTPLGTLAGIGLGAWLTARHQRALTRREQRRECRDACARSLAAHRQLRRHLQVGDGVSVAWVPVADRPDRPTAVVHGADDRWEVYEQARAAFDTVIGDEEVRAAHTVMRTALSEIMRSRADHGAGAVPEAVVNAAVQAERVFAQRARAAFAGPRTP